MDDKFKHALNYMLRWEGGLCDVNGDDGGLTNYGITINLYKEYLGSSVISDKEARFKLIHILQDEVEAVYKRMFWRSVYDDIEHQQLIDYLFDMVVNLSHEQAHILLQRACWACVPNRALLKDDGFFGIKTLLAVNNYGLLMLPPLRAERAGFYRGLAQVNPGDEKFLDGWLNRTYGSV